jgi:hypothetical protein
MAVPNLSRALRGWTKKTQCYIVTKSVVNHQVNPVFSAPIILDINVQPVPAQTVDKKPEGQRAWKWWSIIIKSKDFYLKADDVVVIDYVRYKIMNASDWRRSGFTKYEAIEDYGDA